MVLASDPRSDEELMLAYVAGERAAFKLLFERYAGLLFGMAKRRLGSDDDARDLVQQTMLQMHRARNDFRPGARLRPWLFTIAMNLVREQYLYANFLLQLHCAQTAPAHMLLGHWGVALFALLGVMMFARSPR